MPKLLARNICDTRYEDVNVGDNIDVAPVTRITVGTVSLATGFKTTTYQAPTETKVTISINTWAYGAIALEVYEQAVAAKNLEQLYRQSALDTVLVKIDADALAQIDSFTTNTYGLDNVALPDSTIISAVNDLDENNAPSGAGKRNLIFYPTQYNEFFKLDKWVNANYRGKTPINNMDMGEIYNCNLWKTTQVKAGSAGHVNGLVGSEAIALVVRKKPSAMVLDDPDTQSRKIVYPAIYGSKIMRQAEGVELLGL